ncbi:FtsW/RodA/SpoVE family cell cycle protein, partial [Bacillus cereus]|nr:FtsW/RodA/SpoVE family cell cycle protein [Bacillus cereus]
SQGFLKIGGLNLQPAEVFKLVLIVFLTYMLIKKRKSKLYFIQDVLPVALVSFVPFAMVMAQNDLGNALGYIVIVIGMLWIGNVKASHALIGF